MLALFFQLKMMQSLQFIATLYDDLSEVSGEKSKPNYTVPPFREALTHMLTATSQAVVSEIDKSPNPSEFATLKTSLTTSAVAPVKLQIPPNQFEAVKQKTYVKLNKPYTAPPTANSTPATVPPANTAPASANDEVCYPAKITYTQDSIPNIYGATLILQNDPVSDFDGVEVSSTSMPKLADGVRCEIRYKDVTGADKVFSNMVSSVTSTGPSSPTDEYTEDYMFLSSSNLIVVNNNTPNAIGICEELNNAISIKIAFIGVSSSANPYAGSNYPSANVIDMYKVSTGATWDPAQFAYGTTDTNSLQLSSARIEYTQHVNNDGEMVVYGIPPTGSEVRMNTYYYKESERQWYAPVLTTYNLTYLTAASTFPIDTIYRNPNYEEIAGGGFDFTPENLDQLRLTGADPLVSVSGFAANNGYIVRETAHVPYTAGSPTANSLPHDMHDMSLQIGIPGSASGQASSATMPLMNPLAALAPQAANTIPTFNIDGLVNVNDATPVEYDVIMQINQLDIKIEQADDGSVKVAYYTPGFTAEKFSGQLLGTFVHKGYQWYVDPTTYKSYDFISTNMEMSLYQLTYLPNGELDMNGEASVNWSYNIPRDNFMSMPLTEFNTGSFWFNGSSHNGTEPLNTPLTMKESFATFPGIPDYWKELHNSDYPRYNDEANITYNFKPHNPLWSSATGQNLTVIAQEYGDGYMTIRFEGPGETVLTEFLYSPHDQKVRVEPKASGGNYKLYQMLADDSLVNVQFKAYDLQGNDMIAAGGNGAAFWVEEYDNVRTLYPEYVAGVENNLGGMMDNFTQFYPGNNFINNVPLIHIMAGKFHVEVNNKVANIIRPLNGNPIAYVDHVDNQNPKISNHLLVEFGDMGRQLNIYAVHNSAMSTGGMPMIINDPTAKELLTQFEIAWPSNLSDIPSTPMKFRSTPQTKPLNLSYETLSHHGIQRISFVSAVHETDKLILGIHDVTPWGFTEIKGSTQDPTSGKWYNTFDNDPELIWNALVYDNTFAYETSYAFGNPLPMIVRVELPPQAFGYADYF